MTSDGGMGPWLVTTCPEGLIRVKTSVSSKIPFGIEICPPPWTQYSLDIIHHPRDPAVQFPDGFLLQVA